jgi:hypothetical protein
MHGESREKSAHLLRYPFHFIQYFLSRELARGLLLSKKPAVVHIQKGNKMKSFIRFAVVGVFAVASISSAFAQTSGDQVQYRGQYVTSEGVSEINVTSTITSLENGMAIINSKGIFAGQDFDVSEELEVSGSVLDQAVIAYILDNCEAIGGAIVEVTVKAGTFTACKGGYEDEQGSATYHYAKVPFGLVKSELKNSAEGVMYSYELASFKLGSASEQ